MWWVLLFALIALGGLALLVYVALRVWRSARGLLEELDVLAGQAGELADLVAQVGAVMTNATSSHGSDEGWPGTVETYDDRGATAPGKKES
jgi:hypothetical protein